MSDEEKIVVEPVEVPGMQITFQSPVGAQGKGVSFVLSADALIPVGALNERLDIVAAAARRLDAFEQMRFYQNGLSANRKALPKAVAKRDQMLQARDKSQATLNAKLTVVTSTRRSQAPADASRVAPHDIQTLATLDADIRKQDQTIIDIEVQIAECLQRIPFFQAILRGEEPMDIEPLPMAAE